MFKKINYRIAGSFDTETCNLGSGPDTIAYPVLYIMADLRDVDLSTYKPGDEHISFGRYECDFLKWVDELLAHGIENEYVPIICAYNLIFDLKPVLFTLSNRFDISVNAQSSSNVYTLDLIKNDKPVLRFWDCFHLDMRGLAALGEICGIKKAVGRWDYNLIRTPETELTEDELYYASRDVQVLPAYFKYLIQSNEWLTLDMLGSKVITKTSLVRQMAKKEIGSIKYIKKDGKKISILTMFKLLCKSELSYTYSQYSLRKCCFRGGFTFTAGTWASKVQSNVYSLDVTSMHHAFINGRMLPIRFKVKLPDELTFIANQIVKTKLSTVLENYNDPFRKAINARIRFKKIRLKKNSIFEKSGIALISEAKFKSKGTKGDWGGENDVIAENSIRAKGWYDVAYNGFFAFGKLYNADEVILHLNELELWSIAQVYDFDSLECILGELSIASVKPPDYITLQSNLLFERKQDLKVILKNYKEGVNYDMDIPQSIPIELQKRIENGDESYETLESYYTSTVKGMFNGIYGTQAQDVFKPSYAVIDGDIAVDENTSVRLETYNESRKDHENSLVCYTYGMRIVGGSRMHLIIAMMLLYDNFKDKIRILGGDTDSMKISCDPNINENDLINALKPLHESIDMAIRISLQRIRKLYPNLCSSLKGVGHFEVEGKPYVMHMDSWNKARISFDGEKIHITCAGLPRPESLYHIERWASDMMKKGWEFEKLAQIILGYNVQIENEICHCLEKTHPSALDYIDMDIIDYKGVKTHVKSHQSIGLYPISRIIGDTMKESNMRNIYYIKNIRKENIDIREKILGAKDVEYKKDKNGVIISCKANPYVKRLQGGDYEIL